MNKLNEGIDFDYESRLVSFNPSHEDNIDTSITTNPTLDDSIVKDINVWSIFKRKKGLRGDGNPLIYALKGERNWRFKSEIDKFNIQTQFDIIASKFAELYPIGVTIIIPSSNNLNRSIARKIITKSKNAEILYGVIRKMTTEEVEEIATMFGSKFRDAYKDNFMEAYTMLCDYLDEMDKIKDGYFTRHLITNNKMRNVLDNTLKLSEDNHARFANKINGQHILIIDDTISRGQTIKEAINIIQDAYAPKSITVLTLLSKLYEE